MRIARNTISQKDQIRDNSQGMQEPDLSEDIDRVFIMPTDPNIKSPVFDLSSMEKSKETKLIKSIKIMVEYNLTEYYYKTLHDDTNLMIASAPGDGNIQNGFSLLNSVKPVKQSHENIESNSAHWFAYDATTILSDYNDKIRIYNENFDISSSLIVIEMINNKVSLS